MNKKRKIISLLIIVIMATLWVLIMFLTDHKFDLISWCSGIVFFKTGGLLGEWCLDE